MVNFGVWSDANWFKNIFVQLNIHENSGQITSFSKPQFSSPITWK